MRLAVEAPSANHRGSPASGSGLCGEQSTKRTERGCKMTPTPQEPLKRAYSQRLVLAVLRKAAERGERLTSRQIGERTATTPTVINGKVQAFPISDVRKTISNLRQRGYLIADEWDTNEMGVGFKRYWLAAPQQINENHGKRTTDSKK